MAWLPKGNCYAFCENSISAYAPQASGVYGLYNFDYQLYIGESSNVRAALLQHLGETESQPLRFQPTGFAFETCSAELRAVMTHRLIDEHQPVRQVDWPPADCWDDGADEDPLSYDFTSSAEEPYGGETIQMPANEVPTTIGKRLYFGLGQVVALAAVFVLSLAVIFFLGVLTGESLQWKASAGYESPLAIVAGKGSLDEPVSSGSGFAPPRPEKDEAAQSVKFNAGASPDAPVSIIVPNDFNRPASAHRKFAVSAPLDSVRATTGEVSPATEDERADLYGAAGARQRNPSWAVQLAAHRQMVLTEKPVAELKARGYDAYLVETERDGQSWYRVRVGRFASRAEAEALRGVLIEREGYRSAFITSE